LLHTVTTVGGIIGSCGDQEKFGTRYEAEIRFACLERSGKLGFVESFDEQGQVIPMPSNIAIRIMQHLYLDAVHPIEQRLT
jgi:hypothetical protein